MIDFANLLDRISQVPDENGKFPKSEIEQVIENKGISHISQFPTGKQELYTEPNLTLVNLKHEFNDESISRVDVPYASGKLGNVGKDNDINSLSLSLIGKRKKEWEIGGRPPADSLSVVPTAPSSAVVAVQPLVAAKPIGRPQTPVEAWQASFYRLNSARPPCRCFLDREWPSIFDVVHDFLQTQADEAAAKGWTAEDLFSVHATVGGRRVDCCGALMLPPASRVVSIEADVISFSRTRYIRGPLPSQSVLVWNFGA